ncbi:phospholipase C [Calidifontibacter terrae]
MRLSSSLLRVATAGVAGVALVGGVTAAAAHAEHSPQAPSGAHGRQDRPNATPIKHVVVIFGENVSYDHYFGTYPKAANTDGTTFTAAHNTPRNDNLVTSGALTHNPNLYAPSRLSPSQAMTCDQNHAYGPEQSAVDSGKMDKFVQSVSVDSCTGLYGAPGLAMKYYDGNTVTGLWNYAQHYAMSDNSWDATFGPSTPGALNLISGQTHGFKEYDSKTGQQVATPGSYVLASPNAQGVGTVINDPDPVYDDCSDKNHTSSNTLAGGDGKNVGDLMNAKGVTWGWFQGGFKPTTAAGGTTTYAQCGAAHTNVGGASVVDYSPHHNPFAYYQSTSNPHHLPPTSVSKIGQTDQANHQYDMSDFDTALQNGVMPQVSFLKAPEYQDGHAAYSDPIDEQHFIVNEINAIQKSKFWKDTAIVVAYDDSDGWYDHVAPKITNGSTDAVADKATCTTASAPALGGYQDRCGPSQRLPLVVVSPYAKTNFISHTKTTQPSILKFVEDNWGLGRIGDSSFDASAGSLSDMFNFHHAGAKQVLLNADGSVASVSRKPQSN